MQEAMVKSAFLLRIFVTKNGTAAMVLMKRTVHVSYDFKIQNIRSYAGISYFISFIMISRMHSFVSSWCGLPVVQDFALLMEISHSVWLEINQG